MTGENIYTIYCASAAQLPSDVTRGEALPAWHFLPHEQKSMWERIADDVSGRAIISQAGR